MTTLLTLAFDDASQARFEALRQREYPAQINRVPAHLALFHQLPDTDIAAETLRQMAQVTPPFAVAVTGLRMLGRGVAFSCESAELVRLHDALRVQFADVLIPQDQQRFWPHVVVQNKVEPAVARATLARLSGEFATWNARAEGLLWWEYLGGPWRLRECMTFATARG